MRKYYRCKEFVGMKIGLTYYDDDPYIRTLEMIEYYTDQHIILMLVNIGEDPLCHYHLIVVVVEVICNG